MSNDGQPRRWRRRLAQAGAATVAALVCVLLLGVLAMAQSLAASVPSIPEPGRLWQVRREAAIVFEGPDGTVIGRRGPLHGQWSTVRDLPPHVPAAFLAIEDRRFYQHRGVDLRAMARALVADVDAKAPVQGGSTISQQLARSLFLGPEQTLGRKAREMMLATRLEKQLSKDELLELYLNRIYLGEGAYGVAAAAHTYFSKTPQALSLAEAAVLAALPKAPTRLSPANDMAAVWRRAGLVLQAMVATRAITPEQAQAALAGGPPALKRPPRAPEGDMAWAYDAAAREARALVGDEEADLIVRLTVEPELQQGAAEIVRRAIAGEGRRLGARQAALVALGPDGAIRAMVGGAGEAGGFNRAVQARRQPGSAFKPIVWAAALENGVRPWDRRSAGFVQVGNWAPRNYTAGSYGQVSLARALALSLNTVSVRLAQETGVGRVAETARRFGISSIPEAPGPSIALGAYEVSLLELTAAYQTFQSGGALSRPYLISEIRNGRGEVLYRRPPSGPVPVYPPGNAALMVRMLQGVVEDGTGAEAALDRPAAGKTGTSQDHRDAWFVGFTPDWAAGVWVGNDDGRPTAGITGGALPARVWRRFMLLAHRGQPSVRGFAPTPEWSAAEAAARRRQQAERETEEGWFEAEQRELEPGRRPLDRFGREERRERRYAYAGEERPRLPYPYDRWVDEEEDEVAGLW